MLTNSGVAVAWRQLRRAPVIRLSMSMSRPSFLGVLLGAAVFLGAIPSSSAQNAGDQKPPEQAQKPPGTPPADAAKEEKKKVDEMAEAARILPGPAGHPECVFLGKKVIFLLNNDDTDTALRQLEFYDRFGCPGDHLQQAFACVVRLGQIDKKSPEKINDRVTACWLSPSLPPVLATPATGTPSLPSSQ
jgi:hypothetical protein